MKEKKIDKFFLIILGLLVIIGAMVLYPPHWVFWLKTKRYFTQFYLTSLF